MDTESTKHGRSVAVEALLVALVFSELAACSSLESYRSGGDGTDGGGGGGGARDGETSPGGSQPGSGNAGGAGSSSGGASTGGASTGGASGADAGDAGDAELDFGRDAGETDASSDRAPTVPCGTKIIGPTTTIDFGCGSTFEDFEYLLPLPNPSTPPLWAYVSDTNPNLWELNNAVIYPNPQDSGMTLGAVAVYRSPDIANGSVSAKVWTSDYSGVVRLIARYRDPLHFYRFAASVGAQDWSLERLDGDQAHLVTVGGGFFVGNMPGAYPGRSMRMDFVGNTFSVYVDNVKLADVVDTDPNAFTEGRTGIEIGALADTHVDDFTVTTFP